MSAAFRIHRPASAFALSSGKKRPREKADGHLRFVHGLPCLICGAAGEAAHIRYGDFGLGKRQTGASEKPSDKYTVPLCPNHHRLTNDSQHAHGEEWWWMAKSINPIIISALLWQVSGDIEAAMLICQNARQICGGPT